VQLWVKGLKFAFSATSGSFWTSGINSHDLIYSFCDSGELVNETLWAEGEPDMPEENHCVSLNFETDVEQLTGLFSAHCRLVMPLICQFPKKN